MVAGEDSSSIDFPAEHNKLRPETAKEFVDYLKSLPDGRAQIEGDPDNPALDGVYVNGEYDEGKSLPLMSKIIEDKQNEKHE